MISIPERLLVNNRLSVEEFEPDERLYFRFSRKYFKQENYLPTAAIRFPDFSVNRSAFSEPIDVLIPRWFSFGIAYFLVRHIPAPILTGDQREFRFKVEHDPIDTNHRYYNHPNQQFENYAHSELRVYYLNEQNEEVHLLGKVTEKIKKEFRMKLNNKVSTIWLDIPLEEELQNAEKSD